MATALSSGIEISVTCNYEERFSNPTNSLFMFSYYITIENHNTFPIKLERRRWQIIDSHSHKRVVTGEGVVGQQPIILPGERYSYRSSCDFPTDTGQMAGSYTLRNLNSDESFDVPVPPFTLMVPHRLN